MSLFSCLKIKTTNDSSDLQVRELVGQNDLILGNIFQYIHGEDLKSCRLVCRKWRDVSLRQFKMEMNIVLEENTLLQRWLSKSRLRNVDAFFQDFEGSKGGIPLDSFKLEIPIKNYQWYWKWILSFGSKIKNLTVVIHLVHRRILYELRNVLFNHFQNLENLSLIFVWSAKQIPILRIYDTNDYPRIRGEKKFYLTKLKKIKYTVEDPSFQLERTVKEALFDIIYAAKNVEILEMNLFPCNPATLLWIPEESLANLGELILTDRKWKYYQIREAIEKLAEVGRDGKLKLHSFSLQCDYIHFDYDDIREVIDPKFLLIFLRSQKDCLKSLSIHHQPFRCSVVNAENEELLVEYFRGRDDLIFPKMKKLEMLSLCNSYRNVAWLLSNSPDWTQLFPNLKTLEFHYIIESLMDLYPKLLTVLDIRSESVTKVTLAADAFVGTCCSYNYRECSDKEKELDQMLRLTKRKFPNLRLFEVLGDKAKMYWKCSQGRGEIISHFPNTMILSSMQSNDSRTFIVKEYKRIIDVLEENKKHLELRSGARGNKKSENEPVKRTLCQFSSIMKYCPCCGLRERN